MSRRTTNCFICGLRAGYNRAIVDLHSGVEVGRLCMNCEKEEFGNSLHRSGMNPGDSCLHCDRDGQYALPIYAPLQRMEGDVIQCRVDYEVTNRTVRLCDEHLYALTSTPPDRSPSVRHRV